MVDVFSNGLFIKGVNWSRANFTVDVSVTVFLPRGLTGQGLTSQGVFLVTVFLSRELTGQGLSSQ